MMSKLALGLLAAPALVSAAAYSRVENRCDFNVTLWSVASKVDGPHTIENGTTWGEKFYHDDKTGGIALKITKEEDGLYNGDAQLLYSYTDNTDQGLVYYDLSTVYGDAFDGHKLVLKSEDTSCPEINWQNGYTYDTTRATKSCTDKKHVTLTLCTENPAESS